MALVNHADEVGEVVAGGGNNITCETFIFQTNQSKMEVLCCTTAKGCRVGSVYAWEQSTPLTQLDTHRHCSSTHTNKV